MKSDLFFTTHTYDTNGDVVFTWHKAGVVGSPPVARENAAVSFNGAGNRIYVVGGRDGAVLFDDIRYYDLDQQKWYAVTPSTPISARYDVGLAISNDTLFIGGGVGPGTTWLGDLFEVEGLSGRGRAYGNVLPVGGRPQLSFDDHRHGLIYAGGYVGSTWYTDLWHVTLTGTSATVAFIHNFARDGMVPTPNYSVVADLYHGMFWAVPGFNPGGAQQDLRFLRDETSSVVTQNGGGCLRCAYRREVCRDEQSSAAIETTRQHRNCDHHSLPRSHDTKPS